MCEISHVLDDYKGCHLPREAEKKKSDACLMTCTDERQHLGVGR